MENNNIIIKWQISVNKMANFSFLTIAQFSYFFLCTWYLLVYLYSSQRTTRGLFLVGGCFLREVLGVCSIRFFCKKNGQNGHSLLWFMIQFNISTTTHMVLLTIVWVVSILNFTINYIIGLMHFTDITTGIVLKTELLSWLTNGITPTFTWHMYCKVPLALTFTGTLYKT